MRIFLVVWWFDRMGGMERHVTELALALAGAGHEAIVLSELPVPASNTYGKRLRAAGIRVVAPGRVLGRARNIESGRFATPGMVLRFLDRIAYNVRKPKSPPTDPVMWTPALESAERRGSYNLLSRNILRSLTDLSAEAAPDVIHVHGCRLGQDWVPQWAAARGFPCVYTEHTTLDGWDGPWHAGAAEIVAEADVVACVSESARASLRKLLPSSKHIVVSRHIIRKPDRRNRLSHSSVLAASAKPGTAVCVARLAHEKGLDLLLEALALLRDRGVALQMSIAGEGPERAALERLAAELRLSVHFLGNVNYEDIGELWADAAFGVLPSRTEGLPLSLVEAMAHGKAMVATRAGGIPEILRDEENGLLVPVEDPARLAEAMLRLIEEPGLADRLGTAARLAFELGGWSEGEVTEHTLSLYQQARAGRAPRNEWVREKTREARGEIRRVFFVVWGFSAFGDMEHAIAQQAAALALAGVDVVVMFDSPVLAMNRYAFMMRRAGVRTVAPSWIATMAFRLSLKLGRKSWPKPYSVKAIERECATRMPDAIHVHGWHAGKGWSTIDAVRRLAKKFDVPLVYTEHSEETAAVTGFKDMGVVKHARPERPTAPLVSTVDRFRVFALIGPNEQASFLDFRAGHLADADAVLLSRDAPGFAVTLAEAMALYKPIVLIGDATGLPLRHRSNALVASWKNAREAVTELAMDRVLAHALGIAARRTFESSGCADLAIVAQTAEFYAGR